MKKVLLSVAVVASMAMVSCGGNPMCECAEAEQEMKKQKKEAGDDEAKLEAIEKEFKSQEEACEKLGKEMQEEMKDLSQEEAVAKFKEMAEGCEALEDMMK